MLHHNDHYSDEKLTVKCPECDHEWQLVAGMIKISSCESGGVYSTYIKCPSCKAIYDLWDSE